MTLESAQETAERLEREAELALRDLTAKVVKPASASALLALAERCEKEAPSRELDHRIWWALRPKKTDEEPAPSYTTSLDAAVTLVLSGFIWDMTSTGTAWVMGDRPSEMWTGKASKTALALCAAALRARAAMAADAAGPTGTIDQGDKPK